MKKDELIPQYLQDEIKNLVQMNATYTDEEIDQLSRDWDHVIEQRKQLEEAVKYGAIPEKEAAITRVTLMVKQFVIQETRKDSIRYLKEKLERIEQEIKELKQTN